MRFRSSIVVLALVIAVSYEHVMSHPCHTTARLDDGHDAGTYVVVRVPRVYACG